MFYLWKNASIWVHGIHAFHMHLSYLGPNLVSLFTLRSGRYSRWLLLVFSSHSPNPHTPQQSPWRGVASVGLKFWKPSFTFGGQKSLTAVTHLAKQYGRKYFMSHSKHSISAQPLLTLTISEEKLDIMLIFIPL